MEKALARVVDGGLLSDGLVTTSSLAHVLRWLCPVARRRFHRNQAAVISSIQPHHPPPGKGRSPERPTAIVAICRISPGNGCPDHQDDTS